MYVQHGPSLNPSLRRLLIKDTEWWLEVLLSWEQGEATGREFPIFSAHELFSNPGLVWAMQSDASGPDGFGYHFGQLSSSRHEWVSHIWDDGYEFGSSHQGELAPLLHFLRSRRISACVLIWVSDSLSAVWSVNKGRCHAPHSVDILGEILGLCDE